MAAPVVVVLATVVNAAAPVAHAQGSDSIIPVPTSVDLAWALRGGATQEVQTARVLLARKAASDIRTLDRAHPLIIPSLKEAPRAPAAGNSENRRAVVEAQHVRSSHQHSAP